MDKHRYQAKELQRFEWAQLAEDVKGQRLVFSVDVVKENFYGAFMISALEAPGTIKWQHPGETPARLSEWARLGNLLGLTQAGA